MASTPIASGPLAGTAYQCQCVDECQCDTFTAGAADGNRVFDGFVLWQVYRKVGGVFVAGHVKKEVVILRDICPRCDRPMPSETVNCLNCGADMHNIFE